MGTLIALFFVESMLHPAAGTRWSEQCQIIEAATHTDYGILHSSDCVREEASNGRRISVDAFILQPDGSEVPLLPEGTACGNHLIVVRRHKRAELSSTWTGAVVVELTPKGEDRYVFYSHLEVLEPGTGDAAAVGCGAEGGGVLIKRGRNWSVEKGTQWPDLGYLKNLSKKSRRDIDRKAR